MLTLSSPKMDERLLLTEPSSVLSSDDEDGPRDVNKMKEDDKGDDKRNQCKSKLDCSRSQQQCSNYCVRFGMMKASLSSPLLVCVVVLLLQFSFGSSAVEGVGVDRGVHHQQYRHHHQLHHRPNRQSLNTRSKNGAISGHNNGGEGEVRGLDRVLERLEGKGSGGRRERRDYGSEDSDHTGGANPEQQQEDRDATRGVRKEGDHHHRHSPILPSSSTDLQQRHNPPQQAPRGHHSRHDVNNEDDTGNQGEDSLDEQDDEDEYDDNYDDNDDDLTAGAHDKMSHWAENYKSRYLSEKRKAPSSSTTTSTTTTTTTTTPAPPTPPLTYSQWKWQNLGNRQGLEQYRRQMMGANRNNNVQRNPVQPTISPHYAHHHQQQPNRHGNGRSSSDSENEETSRSAISEAIRHAMRVKDEAECKVPRPRVVHVQDLYPHPSKSYVPHCTILHRCSDDTGCCRQQTETCAPKSTQRVELAFYTISIDQSRDPIVERLVFYNHTECECRDKMDEMMPRDQAVQPSRHSKDSSPEYSPPKLDPITNFVKVDDRDKTKNSQCKCPSVFSKRPFPGNGCSCDCFDGQTNCLDLKRGKDFFNLADKWCIQSGQCEVPECAFGPYVHLIGRCPQKRDMDGNSNSWTKYLSS